eukprot:scaffold52257_cov40-Prasinocladus_malaysianus.AAC.1
MCSLRIEQGRPDEAIAHLEQSLSKWFKGEQPESSNKIEKDGMTQDTERCDDVEPFEDNLSGSEEDVDSEVLEDEAVLPSYEFRIETAKLLLELDDTTDRALQVGIPLGNFSGSLKSSAQATALCPPLQEHSANHLVNI